MGPLPKTVEFSYQLMVLFYQLIILIDSLKALDPVAIGWFYFIFLVFGAYVLMIVVCLLGVVLVVEISILC